MRISSDRHSPFSIQSKLCRQLTKVVPLFVSEALEARRLLSGTVDMPATVLDTSDPDGHLQMASSVAPQSLISPDYSGFSAPSGLTPNQIRGTYGLGSYTNGVPSNELSFAGIVGDGRGQTIAIVDQYDDPNAASDLNAFSSYFGLPTFGGTGNPTFQKLNQTGGTSLPATDPGGPYSTNGNLTWEVEESLDIEWAHVMAPMANLILFEANNGDGRYTAIQTADNMTGVVVVSMSWGGTEGTDESTYDTTYFVTPSGHIGGSASVGGTGLTGNITFVTSAGDNGVYSGSKAPGNTTITPQYPACSPYVVAVGGTTLTVNGTGTYYTRGNETVWGSGTSSGTNGGGGSGISADETQPAYQNGVVNAYSTSNRTYPDISLDGNPNTGVPYYDSWDMGNSTPWNTVGGTSLSAPLFAGMVAVADEGRAIHGLGSLDGRNQVLPTLYNLAKNSTTYARDFYDITSGSNGPSPTYAAGPGYDLASGLGSPVGNLLIPALLGFTLSANEVVVAQEPPVTVTAGSTISPGIVIYVTDDDGNIITTDNSNVTLSVGVGPGSLQGTTTVRAVNGVATFSNLSLDTAGSYWLWVTDGSLTSTGTNIFTVTPAAAYQVTFAQQPTNGFTGAAISPAVTVDVEDAWGNIVTTDSSRVYLSVSTGPGSLFGTVSVNAVNGVATFNNVWLDQPSSDYILYANYNYGTLGAYSSQFTVTPLASALVFGQQPTNSAAGEWISPAMTVRVVDNFGNLVTTDSSSVTVSVGAGPGSLLGTTTVQAVNGVATFSNLYLTIAGNYWLSATDGSLYQPQSNTFSIIAATAYKLAFAQQPTNTTAGVMLSPAVSVKVEDHFGNIVTTDNSSVILGTEVGPGPLVGTITVSAVNGVATFGNLSVDFAGQNYQLGAWDGSLVAAVSNTFTVSPAAPSQLRFIQQPTTTPIGIPISPAITVGVEDQFYNIVTGVNSSVNLYTYSGPANLQGTTTVTAVNGVATFGNASALSAGIYELYASSMVNSTWMYSNSSNQFIVQDTTTTRVNASIFEPTYSQSVTFTATVTPANGASGETGTVQFQIDGGNIGSPVAVSGNTAAYTTSLLGKGAHSVVAVYSGDGNFAGSTSSPDTEIVDPVSGSVWDADTFTFNGTTRVSGTNLNGLNEEVPAGTPIPWTVAQLYDGGSFVFGGNATNSYLVPNTNHTSDLASVPAALSVYGPYAYMVQANLYPDVGNATDMGYLAVGFYKEQSGNYLWQSPMTALSLQLQPNGNWSLQTGGSSNYTYIASGNISLSAYTPATAPLVSLTWYTSTNTASGSIGSNTLFTNLTLPAQASYTTVKAVGISRDATLGANSRVDNFAFMFSAAVAPPTWLAATSAANWNASNETLTVTGNTTILGDPSTFGDNPTIIVSSATGSLLVDTAVADGGDGDGVVQIMSINGSGTITVNPRNSLLVGNFSQPALVNYGAVAIDGNGTIGQLSGSGNLTIGTGSSNNTVQLTAATTPDSVTDTQSAVTINAGSTLDITNNTLLINYGSGSTPLAAVQAAVAYGAGVSGASGAYGSIISSTANAGNAGQYTIGYADSTELSSIASGNVEVMYTLTGDANLDGRVNFNDFSLLQNNYDQSGRDWSQGDYNHDGLVNFNDFSLLQNNYDQNIAAAIFSSAAIGSGTASGANSTAAATSSAAVVYGVYSPASQTPLFTNDLIETDTDAAVYT